MERSPGTKEVMRLFEKEFDLDSDRPDLFAATLALLSLESEEARIPAIEELIQRVIRLSLSRTDVIALGRLSEFSKTIHPRIRELQIDEDEQRMASVNCSPDYPEQMSQLFLKVSSKFEVMQSEIP